MIGWRARLGFLVPPGNPTVEPEVIALAPAGVSVHFHRMSVRDAPGILPGSPEGQEARTAAMVESLGQCVGMLALVNPDIIVVAHTATSYHLGREREAELLTRLGAASGVPVVSAFAAVVAAFERLGVRRIALGAPYSAETTAQGRRHLKAHGYTVVCSHNLEGVTNIYDETAERAYRLAKGVDRPDAEAVFLSGTGLPTLSVLAALEADLGKPVLSSNAAMTWHALRLAGVRQPITGYGRLLTLP